MPDPFPLDGGKARMGVKRRGEASDGLQSRLLIFILLHGLTRPWAILVKMTSVIPAPAGIQGARAAHAVWGWDGTPLAFIPLHGLTRPWAIAAKAGTPHPLGLTGQGLSFRAERSGVERSLGMPRVGAPCVCPRGAPPGSSGRGAGGESWWGGEPYTANRRANTSASSGDTPSAMARP